MRIFLILFTILAYTSLGAAQDTTYLNEEGQSIPWEVYKTLWSPYALSLEVAPDTFQYITREFEGQISQPEKIYNLLSQASGRPLDSDDVVIILYQNGGDEPYDHLNDGDLKSLFDRSHKYLSRLDAKYFFLCPNPGAMGRLAPRADWVQDPGGFFGRHFFKYKTRYESYLVMGGDGRYTAYLSEHTLGQIKDAAKWVRKR